MQIGNGGGSMHPTGRSHVDDYGYPGWGDKTDHPFTYVLYVYASNDGRVKPIKRQEPLSTQVSSRARAFAIAMIRIRKL